METSELTGIALDWAVAKCEELLGLDSAERFLHDHRIGFTTRYSVNWSQGGPIIEREGIEIRVHCTHNNAITSWAAEKDWPMDKTSGCCGPTPLIAAMRCYVASKLGNNVDVPEELL